MEKEEKATEQEQPIATATEGTVVPSTDDAEARVAALEAEKAALIEESANYKLAYLKEKKKKEEVDLEENDEERTRRIAREEVANSKISQIDSEKEALLKKIAKENSELKLALQNKTTTPPASIGSHSEGIAPQDTTITPEQMAAFKARGWTEKDIERYKKNLQKNSR